MRNAHLHIANMAISAFVTFASVGIGVGVSFMLARADPHAARIRRDVGVDVARLDLAPAPQRPDPKRGAWQLMLADAR